MAQRSWSCCSTSWGDPGTSLRQQTTLLIFVGLRTWSCIHKPEIKINTPTDKIGTKRSIVGPSAHGVVIQNTWASDPPVDQAHSWGMHYTYKQISKYISICNCHLWSIHLNVDTLKRSSIHWGGGATHLPFQFILQSFPLVPYCIRSTAINPPMDCSIHNLQYW